MILRLIILVLLTVMGTSCSEMSAPSDDPLPAAQKNMTAEVKTLLFDGIHLKNINISNGRISPPHDISTGYFGVVFFIRSGFLPETVVFRASENGSELVPATFKKISRPNQGVLTGVIYTPASGGKLNDQQGIFRLFGSETIQVVQGQKTYAAVSDKNGIFRVVLPAGNVDIIWGRKKTGPVPIKADQTTIRTLQKGFVLLD